MNLIYLYFSSYLASDYFGKYQSYKDMMKWYKDQSRKHNFIKIKKIGSTYEGRDINAVHISKNSSKKKIFIQSLLHSREWLSGSTSNYFVNYLIENIKDKEIMNLLSQVEIILIPIANPDGYEYSRISPQTRMWRKNRHPLNGGEFGVDLNRNFPVDFGKVGSPDDPRAETYRGESAGSELETKAVMKHFLRYKDDIIASLDIHTFGQMLLSSYGFSKLKLVENDNKIIKLRTSMINAIKNVRGTVYKGQKGADLYPASGGADDWFFINSNKGYSFTIELSPGEDANPLKGFALSSKQIVPVAKEVIPGIITMIKGAIKDPINQ